MSNNNYSHTDTNQLVRDTSALILAGGKGTRLKQLTSQNAKPAVSFGGKFRIIDFTLSNCINSGIRRVGVLTQYMAQDLIEHLQEGWQILSPAIGEGVQIIPAQQRTGEAWYRGTADAVYQNLDLIKRQKTSRVLILGGDHIYKMDYSRMLNFHVENDAAVTVACIHKPIEEASSFGVMGLNANGEIQTFVEKPENPMADPNDPSKALVSMGIYIFNTDILSEELISALEDPNYNHDFGHNIIPGLLGRHKVCGYVFTERGHPGRTAYWRDVGNLDEYYAATMDLLSPDPELDLYSYNWPIITNAHQGPGAKFVFNDDGRRGYAVDSVVSGGVIVSGSAIERSMISIGVRTHSYSNIRDSILLPHSEVGRNCRLTKVIVGEGCKIPDGTVIGENPEQDAQKYTVSPGGVILVTSDMFL
ncbi:glucose-1-phosphate adenylyltransferase [Vibrio sp. HA2012]|uniref:glucose-1-phosphate adenylyltransferase n=1 Tax=Vibrio sp. HA2012 TaxID=1971595 RepID=UPI000C2CDFB2|nr:glucose-1-phosphate adenylyltransferase [Vibrio sp. HA2012]PJC87865.1 glucose-1-phosphate adenylyltransferase [Vibrio sp. HA2012]